MPWCLGWKRFQEGYQYLLIPCMWNHHLEYGLKDFALQNTPGSAIHIDYDVNGTLGDV